MMVFTCFLMKALHLGYKGPFICKVVSSSVLPWAFRDILGKHGLHQLGHFVLSAQGTPHIVGYVCIDARPVCHCFDEYWHLLGALLAFM